VVNSELLLAGKLVLNKKRLGLIGQKDSFEMLLRIVSEGRSRTVYAISYSWQINYQSIETIGVKFLCGLHSVCCSCSST